MLGVVQARMGSTRLPGKVLRPIRERPLIYHLVDRLDYSDLLDDIVFAIPASKENDVLFDWLSYRGLKIFRGSEKNVLQRFYNSAKKYNPELIVRICSDRPITDPWILDKVIQVHIDGKADYTSNNLKNTYPTGLDVEVFSLRSLKKAYNEATKDYEREHVTPFFYEHPQIFDLHNVEAEGKLNRPDLRLTVDREEDLKLIRKIYKELYHPGKVFSAEVVVDFLDENPQLQKINADIEQKGLKE